MALRAFECLQDPRPPVIIDDDRSIRTGLLEPPWEFRMTAFDDVRGTTPPRSDAKSWTTAVGQFILRRTLVIASACGSYVFLSYFFLWYLESQYREFPVVKGALIGVQPLAATLLCALVAPSQFAKPSDLVLFYSLYSYFIPLFMFLHLWELDFQFVAVSVFSYFVLCILSAGRPLPIPAVPYGPPLLAAVTAAILGIPLARWLWNPSLYPISFDLSFLYDLRDEVWSSANTGLIGYLLGWGTNVANIYLLLLGFKRRQILLIAAALALQALFFLMTQEKRVLLLPFLAAALWMTFDTRNGPRYVFGLIAGVVIGTSIVDYFFDAGLVALLTRREYFIPATVTAGYFIVYEQAAHTYWTQSFIGGYTGAYPPPLIVGHFLTRNWESSANTGFLGAGFMNAGMLGIIVYSVVLGIIFRLANSLVVGRIDLRLGATLCFYPLLFAIVGGDLPVMLLSHGLLILLVYLGLMGQRAPAAYGSDSVPQHAGPRSTT